MLPQHRENLEIPNAFQQNGIEILQHPTGKKCQGLLSTSCHLMEKEKEVNAHQRREGRMRFTFLMVSVLAFCLAYIYIRWKDPVSPT